MDNEIRRDPFRGDHQRAEDQDDECVVGLVFESLLRNLSSGISRDPPSGIASDNLLSKLHRYARFLRFSLAYDFDRAVEQLEEICMNTSLQGFEHECERIARWAFYPGEPGQGNLRR